MGNFKIVLIAVFVGVFYMLPANALVPIDAEIDYVPYTIRTIESPTQPYTYSRYNTKEMELFSKVNSYRRSVGKRYLSKHTYLSKKAEEHVDYMIRYNHVSHKNFPARASNIMNVLRAESVGENIAYAYYSTTAIVSAWERSDGHRRNLEGNWTHFGVSAKRSPYNGRYYYLMIFARL